MRQEEIETKIKRMDMLLGNNRNSVQLKRKYLKMLMSYQAN
jgi:hypothetical protein